MVCVVTGFVLTDDSHEMSSLIFFKNRKKVKMSAAVVIS